MYNGFGGLGVGAFGGGMGGSIGFIRGLGSDISRFEEVTKMTIETLREDLSESETLFRFFQRVSPGKITPAEEKVEMHKQMVLGSYR